MPDVAGGGDVLHISPPVGHWRGGALPVNGLPIARFPMVPDGPGSIAVITSADHSGRLGDRSVIRRLGWGPGTTLRVRLVDAAWIEVAEGRGPLKVTDQGYLRLPLAIRRLCQLRAGARLLVMAWNDFPRLIACDVSVIASVVRERSGSADSVGSDR